MPEPDFQNLLRLLRLTGGKFIIVDDGKPSAVLMDYKEFEDLAAPKMVERLMDKVSDIERVNRQITRAQMQDLRQEVIQPDFEPVIEDAQELDPEAAAEITIEPLEPF